MLGTVLEPAATALARVHQTLVSVPRDEGLKAVRGHLLPYGPAMLSPVRSREDLTAR